jgi:DNA polymerase-3 subunit gamma/tau
LPPVSSPQSDTAVANPFDGNWTGFVERQNFQGMAGLLARYGEMTSFEANHLVLVLHESHRMYAEKAYQDKLKSELVPRFGPGFRLSVKVGETSGSSVAAVRGFESQKKLDNATAALESDPFVRELVDGMGAHVVATSIRPMDESGSDNTEHRRTKP